MRERKRAIPCLKFQLSERCKGQERGIPPLSEWRRKEGRGREAERSKRARLRRKGQIDAEMRILPCGQNDSVLGGDGDG